MRVQWRRPDLSSDEPDRSASCGQRGFKGLDRGCVNVRPQEAGPEAAWDTQGAVVVRDSLVRGAYTTAVLIDRAHGVKVQRNVIFDVLDYGVRAIGQNNEIVGNLVAHIGDGWTPTAAAANTKSWAYRWETGEVKAYGLAVMGRGTKVQRNVVAGSEALGILTDGHTCDGADDQTDNVVHNALVGVYVELRGFMSNKPGKGGGWRGVYGTHLDEAAVMGKTTRTGYAIKSSVPGTCYELKDWSVHSTTLMGVTSGRAGGPRRRRRS